MAVESVVGDFLSPGFLQISGELVRVHTGALVIDEVLQMVRIAVFLRRAQEDNGLADEDAALGLLGGHVGVHERIARDIACGS